MKKVKSLIPNRNNIETYLPVFHGFYGSHWDEPDFNGEAEHFNLPEDFPFYEYLNWSAYKNDLAKAFCDIIEDQLKDYVERIEYQSISSPKEYNFTNDSINCIIRPKKQAIKDFIFAHETAFRQYLVDNLKSRDGFISFHSYDFKDWQEETKNFTAFDKKADPQGFNLGFILQFIAEETDKDIEDYDKITNSLSFSDIEVYPSNYYNETFDKILEALDGIKDLDYIDLDGLNKDADYTDKLPNVKETVNEIKKFIQDHYVNTDLESLVNARYYATDEVEFIDLSKLFKSVIAEIENNTLTLDLK